MAHLAILKKKLSIPGGMLTPDSDCIINPRCCAIPVNILCDSDVEIPDRLFVTLSGVTSGCLGVDPEIDQVNFACGDGVFQVFGNGTYELALITDPAIQRLSPSPFCLEYELVGANGVGADPSNFNFAFYRGKYHHSYSRDCGPFNTCNHLVYQNMRLWICCGCLDHPTQLGVVVYPFAVFRQICPSPDFPYEPIDSVAYSDVFVADDSPDLTCVDTVEPFSATIPGSITVARPFGVGTICPVTFEVSA